MGESQIQNFFDSFIGKQNHSATYPCAWTNVSKDHLQNHSGKDHSPSHCRDVTFLKIEDYEKMLTLHFVEQGGKTSAKTGKDFGSVVATNLAKALLKWVDYQPRGWKPNHHL